MNRRKALLLAVVCAGLLAVSLVQIRKAAESRALQAVIKTENATGGGNKIVLPNMPDPFGNEGTCEPTTWGEDEPQYYPVPINTSFYGYLRDAKVLEFCDIMLVFFTGKRFMSASREGTPEGMPFSAVLLYGSERAMVDELRLEKWYYVEVNSTGYPAVLEPVEESEVKGLS